MAGSRGPDCPLGVTLVMLSYPWAIDDTSRALGVGPGLFHYVFSKA